MSEKIATAGYLVNGGTGGADGMRRRGGYNGGMSYQVLARKWRPAAFDEVVGQGHALRALSYALSENRLHHAYLFSGTRGVGKTTIARIFAKCLNCEQGPTAKPCGKCHPCTEIAAGKFVDLIEVDAASRTQVDSTRELMDNVPYAPIKGRYKVYLIDEVHMLSTHSFNALLKTLEEPPGHVKFLLATTDPQKLPVTVLSRCLQFSLHNLAPELIAGQLKHILKNEKIPFEEQALWQLARHADGSMRDALSLSDQCIAAGGGKLAEAEVAAMLGTLEGGRVSMLLTHLLDGDGKALMAALDELAGQALSADSVLADLLELLHRVALAQALPDAIDNSRGDRDQLLDCAARASPEAIQLYYQIALMGRRDLAFAPQPQLGLEMCFLRLLAFAPESDSAPARPRPAAAAEPPPAPAPEPQPEPEPEPQSEPQSEPESELEPPPSAAAEVVDDPAAQALAERYGGRVIPKDS